jgi:hypothetical protein
LKPVVATLGSTRFTTTGFVVKHDGDTRKTIFFEVSMPAGNLRDVLMLAMKGAPIMEGSTKLNTKIGIPPLAEKVKEKLLLDGTFEVTHGKFLRSRIQEKIDALSHRSQGKTKNEEIDAVVHRMSGEFKVATNPCVGTLAPFRAAINGGVFDRLRINSTSTAPMLDAKIPRRRAVEALGVEGGDPFFSKRGGHVPAYQSWKRRGSAVWPRSRRHQPCRRGPIGHSGKEYALADTKTSKYAPGLPFVPRNSYGCEHVTGRRARDFQRRLHLPGASTFSEVGTFFASS